MSQLSCFGLPKVFSSDREDHADVLGPAAHSALQRQQSNVE